LSDVPEAGGLLLVDAANVIGSRPDGWWKDRPGAARKLVQRIRTAVGERRLAAPVVIVLEGQARSGVEVGEVNGVSVLHAPGSGDDTLVSVTADSTDHVTLVSADRALRQRVQALGADVVGPRWLTDVLDA
jgi:hypothetical protein